LGWGGGGGGDRRSWGTRFAVLLAYYFHSVSIGLGVLPTALLTLPFAILAMIFYVLFIDKFVFIYYRIKKSLRGQLAKVRGGVRFVTQAIIRIIIGPLDRRGREGEKYILRANESKEITG
jgi:hypothetical protein